MKIYDVDQMVREEMAQRPDRAQRHDVHASAALCLTPKGPCVTFESRTHGGWVLAGVGLLTIGLVAHTVM